MPSQVRTTCWYKESISTWPVQRPAKVVVAKMAGMLSRVQMFWCCVARCRVPNHRTRRKAVETGAVVVMVSLEGGREMCASRREGRQPRRSAGTTEALVVAKVAEK